MYKQILLFWVNKIIWGQKNGRGNIYKNYAFLKSRPTPILLPGKSHGQRSLVGCSPWGPEELDMTEWLLFHFSLSCIGEGNGNPLQCSCLENPRDGGAWWAAIYGITQNRTRLKWLSSSSSSSKSTIQCFTATLSGPLAVALVAAYGIAGKEEVGHKEN